jgi:hypothetical protein
MARELLYALDPVLWAIERLDFTPDPWQARVMRSSAKQTLLNCSRQSGKSTTTGALAAHTAIFRPGSLTLLVSKAQRQSGELLAKVTGFLKSLNPPPELDSDNLLSLRLSNGSRILSLPGDGDSIRGFSAPDLIVEDEAAFVTDELYTAVRPMLAVSKNARLILMSTPHGRRGHFFQAWTNGSTSWERESIMAVDVPRITKEFLDQERENIGQFWFSQEYECKFVDSDSQLFSSDSIARAFSRELEPLVLIP